MFLDESVICTLNLFNWSLEISNLLIASVVYGFIMILLTILYKTSFTMHQLINKCFNFVKGVSIVNAGNQRYVMLLFFLFIAILIGNTMRCFGFFAINGFYLFPMIYAFVVCFTGFFFGFVIRRWKFFWDLVPHDVPILLKPPLMIMETLTLLIRPITLCARLFLNIAIGHIVIHALQEVVHMFGSFGIFGLPIFVVINFMEIGVGIIQAYVFIVFSSLFISSCTEQH